MIQQITLNLERETKGAVRYEESARQSGDPEYLIGTLYLRKAYLRAAGIQVLPMQVTVTVEADDNS